MFMRLYFIHKFRCLRLLTIGLVLCVVLVCWRQSTFSYHYSDSSNNLADFAYNYNRGYHHKNNGSDSVSGVVRHPYLINHPQKCRDGNNNVLLLLFVKSSPQSFERRQAIRETWGNESYISLQLGAIVRVVFALGVHPVIKDRPRVQRALFREDQTYGDLIQQDFVDTFRNLTAKLILQFHWAYLFCPDAHFFMSADDDVFVHVPNLVKFLRQAQSSQTGAKDLWVGHVNRGAIPVRRTVSRYYIPYELYPWPSYPDYTSGAGYVLSRDVVAKIYHATLLLDSSLYIDDAFMGVCAKAMGVSPQEYLYFAGETKAPYHHCIYERMITSHGHTTDLRSLWQAVTGPTLYNHSSSLMGNLYCTAVRVMLLCRPHSQPTYSCMAAFT